MRYKSMVSGCSYQPQPNPSLSSRAHGLSCFTCHVLPLPIHPWEGSSPASSPHDTPSQHAFSPLLWGEEETCWYLYVLVLPSLAS